MQLIRIVRTEKTKKGNTFCIGLFLCLFCLREVEKHLSAGKLAKSCGCASNKLKQKHNESHTKLYRVWDSMKRRILNSNHKAYKNYGGRGITICDEWLEFIPFRDWSLNNGYQEGLEIDRENNDKGYCPENCRWVTRKENMRNMRTVKLSLKIVDEIKEKFKLGFLRSDIAIKYNVSWTLINNIIKNKSWVN